MFEFVLSIWVALVPVGTARMPRWCAATLPLPLRGKDIPILSCLLCRLCRRGGGGVEDGQDLKDTGLGSLRSNVLLEEIWLVR